MNRFRSGLSDLSLLPSDKKLASAISQKNVKLCELCGTLNLLTNKECWTCRWRGSFSRHEQTIMLAWQRLESLYEEVRVEHVTARRSSSVGDFGAAHPAPWPKRLAAGAAAWWQHILDNRDLRMAQRQARLKGRMPSPPDQLSI